MMDSRKLLLEPPRRMNKSMCSGMMDRRSGHKPVIAPAIANDSLNSPLTLTAGDGAANGYNHGIYSDSIGIYGKKKKTIIAPSDTHYIHVLFSSGILQTYTRCTGIQAQRRLCFYQQEEVYCNLTDSLGKYWCMDRQQRRVARLGA